MITITCWKCQV